MKYLSFLLVYILILSIDNQSLATSYDLVMSIDTLKPKAIKKPKPKIKKPSSFKETDKIKPLFQVVEVMPRFPGCEDMEGSNADKKSCADQKMLEYIYQNIRYPMIARENGVQGMVVVSFIVEKNGKLTEAKAIRDIGAGCGEEVVKIVENMNNLPERWRPGYQRGEPVRVQYNLPVNFRLEGDDDKETDAIESEQTMRMPLYKGCAFPSNPLIEQKCTELELEAAINKEMNYPRSAVRKKIEGMVIVQVTVAADGSLSNPKIINKLNKKCDKEALRIVKTLPNFEPALKDGKPAETTYDIFVRFNLKEWRKTNKARKK